MSKRKYIIVKNNNFQKGTFKLKKNHGFKVRPKNNVKYDGIKVRKLVILNKLFISKLLMKKIKRKLNLYLELIVDAIDLDEDDTDGEVYRESLDDLSRFKDIVKYKYKKHLDAKYIKLLLKKIELFEYELNEKIVLNNFNYKNEVSKQEKRSKKH